MKRPCYTCGLYWVEGDDKVPVCGECKKVIEEQRRQLERRDGVQLPVAKTSTTN